MTKHPIYILLIIFLFSGATSFSQIDIDKILKPVEINPPGPPHPGEPPKKKKESDEQLAAQYFRNKEFEKAAVLYEKLYAEKKSSIYYTYYLYCLIELKEYKSAEKIVKDQIKKYPDRSKFLVDLGYVYNEAEDFKKAKKQFEEALENIPPNKSRIIELANAFLYRGQSDYAVETYNLGRKVMKDYPFYLELGNLYKQMGNHSLMIEEYLNYVDYDYINMPVIQQKLQSILNDDPDNTVSNILRKSLLTKVQKSPDKVYFSEMLLWLTIQEKDFELALTQARAIDRRFDEEGVRVYELAGLCLANSSYDIAIEAYKYVEKKGRNNFLYIDSRIGILKSRYQKITNSFDYSDNDILELEKDYIAMLDEYGKNSSTISVMQYLGNLQTFYLYKTSEAIDLLNEAIYITNAPPNLIAECKIELADVYLFTGEVWESKLLYAQVEKAYKHDPLGHVAKYKNAKLSFYIGEFEWAKTQLDVLKAATSKLIANDALRFSVLISDNIDVDSSTVALNIYAHADLLLYRNKPELALLTLDSIFELADWHPIFDEVLYKKAEIKLKQRKFVEAAELLNDIVENHSWDITADDALFVLAQLYEEEFEDKNKAMELYQQLLEDYPGSLFTAESRKRFRKLRGDFNIEGT